MSRTIGRSGTTIRRLARATVLVAALCIVSGEAASQVLTLSPRTKIRESVRRRAPLGGPGTVVGVMAWEPETLIRDDVIYTWLPSTTPSVLCVWLTSADGVYEVAAEFNLPRVRPAGQVRLELEADSVHVIQTYTPSQIAILARVGTNCRRGATGPFILAAWSRGADPRTMAVLVAARAEWTVIAGINPTLREQPCEFHAGSTVRYDRRCEIRGLRSGQSVHRFHLRRRKGRDRRPDLPVDVAVP